ncbi:NUDIX domain-containing protein [Moraxella marmotae]|uniref:NUDIX domain-containing protein n=1 Tax=Moraxella marmotae TaxID=3344520 RepID=UPI0035F27996
MKNSKPIPNPNLNPNPSSKLAVVEVAVAILRYADQFLLAQRALHQHQGGKLEFVGGKIEQGESGKTALCREVQEEIGLHLQSDQLVCIGKIHHDYGDKAVCLHIYEVYLNESQYQSLRHRHTGAENQRLHWLTLPQILANAERLPAANLRILSWLKLPPLIYISRALGEFASADDFVRYYVDNLPNQAYFYLRACVSVDASIALLAAIRCRRDDIVLIVPYSLYQACKHQAMVVDGLLVKLRADELTYFYQNPWLLDKHLPIFVGVHDEVELNKVNALARSHQVLAAWISPVQATLSHPDAAALGWQGFAKLNRQCDVPSVALGGLSVDDWHTAKAHGAIAVAAIRGLLKMTDENC